MTLLQLKYFFSVAECLSFSKAAEEHYTSQPSISRQIAQLEAELGIKLFQRNRHSVQLTPQGKLLYDEFSELFQRARIAYTKAAQLGTHNIGKLKIGYLQETNMDIFMPLISLFSEKHPEIEVLFEGYGFRDLRNKLLNGALDIAFMLSFELGNMPPIQQRQIYPTRACIVISASHPLAEKEMISPEDMRNESVIVAAETELGKDFVLSQCENFGFTPKNIISSTTSEAIIMYVESRRAIAIMDPSNRFYQDSRFRFYEIPGDQAKISVNAAWRSDNNNPVIPLFDAVLQAQCAE